MTKLELLISPSSLRVISFGDTTGVILGCRPDTPVSEILADDKETSKLEVALEKFSGGSLFETLDLVFLAPGIKKHDSITDRSKIDGVFRSPMEAIHLAGDLEISAFVHLWLDEKGVHMTALEYSRKHRQQLLRREFGSWLLEEHIEKAVIATTMIGEVVFWNRFASELYGYKAEEVIGKNIVEVNAAEMTHDQAMEIMGKLAKGEHWTGQFKVKKKSGETFLAHVTDTPIMGTNGQCEYIVGVSADYTQLYDLMEELSALNADLEMEVQKRTQQLLEKSKALRMVGAAVKASDTGVIVTDNHQKIVWLNDAVCNLLSTDESDLKGLSPEHLPYLNQNEHWKAFVRASKGSLSSPGDEIDVNGLLQIGHLHVTSQALSLDDIDHHLITLRDVTSQKEAEQLHFAAEKAIAMSKAKTEMMQVVSHELRSPLQGIMGMTSTMLADMAPNDTMSPLFDEISTILASSRVLLTLINTILDVRKIDENMMDRIEVKPLHILSSIKTAMSFCAPFAAQQGVPLLFEPTLNTEEDFMVLGNRMRLEQIMINLITNSVKYGSVENTVNVTARKASVHDATNEALGAAASDLKMNPLPMDVSSETTENELEVVIVSVRDFGRGIPTQEYGKVFGSFSQLSISKEREEIEHHENSAFFGQTSGSGLGLNLVMKFVTSMGGHVWFNNCTDGPGVRFSFCLPSCAGPSESTRGNRRKVVDISKPMDSPEPIARVAQNQRVLVVDDTRINLKVLSKMLTRLGCETVWSASNGTEALEYLRTAQTSCPEMLPTLIISDLNMPGMSGHELIKTIREMELPTKPYAFAWSADWGQGVIDACLSAGFNEILRKPLDIRDLERVLSERFPALGPDMVPLSLDDSGKKESNGSSESYTDFDAEREEDFDERRKRSRILPSVR